MAPAAAQGEGAERRLRRRQHSRLVPPLQPCGVVASQTLGAPWNAQEVVGVPKNYKNYQELLRITMNYQDFEVITS